jgi:integrase/recombinase XerD
MKHPFTGIGIRAMEREIGKIAENAGFDKSIYPHLLRHTMATLGLRAGASLTTIQKLLGHEDPGTTEIYAEIGDETVAQEYRKHLAL